MKLQSILRAAARNLRRAPLRSALTTLGIIVGVSAVIATASIGNGAREKIERTLENPRLRLITVEAFPRPSTVAVLNLEPKDQLKAEDYYALRHASTFISAASPRSYVGRGAARGNGKSATVRIEGYDVDEFPIASFTLVEGQIFTPSDVRRAANVCVVNEAVAVFLYTRAGDGIGRLLSLNSMTCTVIGVVRERNSSRGGISPMLVYVPFTTLLRRLDRESPMSIDIQVREVAHVAAAQQAIQATLEDRRGDRKAQFAVQNDFDSLKAYSDSSLAVARLLAAVGSIALIVGGIGIMNIMTISVTERTREIGILLALGTRSRDILLHYLTESAILGLVGGGMGIAVGVGVAYAITGLYAWPTEITPGTVLTALSCGVGVGLLFGYHPARRASTLQPVDALRSY